MKPPRASWPIALILVASLPFWARSNAPLGGVESEERAIGASWVWLGQKLRREIVSTEVARIPESAVLLIHGKRSYFLDRGEGRYELRAVEQAPRKGERTVVDGAFLLKSELLR